MPTSAHAALHRNVMIISRLICPLEANADGAQNAGESTVRYMAACASPESSELVFGWKTSKPSQTLHAMSQGAAAKAGPGGGLRPLCQMANHATRAITNAAILVKTRNIDTPGMKSRAGMNVCATRNHSSQPHGGSF